MSNIVTVASTENAALRSTTSILLSPSKRQRVERPANPRDVASRQSDVEDGQQTGATDPAIIHRWTFTRAAIAPCFVRDVFDMRESGSRDMEYFWIGRIPCRTVCIVGLVVGVVVWEKRTVYTVDDGTAVVDCAHAHPHIVPPSPVKSRWKDKASNIDAHKTTGPSFSDYLRPTRFTPSSSVGTTKRAAAEPPPLPKPVARIGQAVRIVGRVISRHDTRSLLVDEISLCASSNDEPTHWITVSDLHRAAYYPTEKLPPFVPPPLPSATSHPSTIAHSQPGTPSRHASGQHRQVPGTPASVHSSVTSAASTPSTSVSGSSPARTGDAPQSPVRLRHPGRLHTRDLTVHTLRIYIKHYMDNAPPPTIHRRSSRSRSVSPSPTPRHSQRRKALDTPTATQKGKAVDHGEETPRPSRIGFIPTNRTPRLSLTTGVDSDTEDEDDGPEALEDNDQVYGYTLSHLRRVPELALLARRIVKAEAHRREKEERKKAKAASSKTAPKSVNAPRTLDAKTQAAAMKRLFRQAIRTLFQEGSIVLWDGPTRPLPEPALDPLVHSSFSSALWKANSSTSSSMSTSTTSTSKSSRSFPSYDEWDDDEPLSEPQPGEEAYIPLTPAYFSRVLERAITSIMAETSAASSSVSEGVVDAGDATPRPSHRKPTSLIERLRAQESQGGGGSAPPGPTAQELLAWLRNSDERWARVGLWSVEEALEWGRKEGRVWCVGKGRWEVCG